MRSELEHIKIIEQYLRNELSAVDKQTFENKLNIDNNLHKEVELQLQVPYPNAAVAIPRSYVFNKLEQDYVKLANGNEIPLISLRKDKEFIIVNLSALPANAELIQPVKK